MHVKIILLDYQNNYVGNSEMMSNVAKNLIILTISLNVLHNYLILLILIKLFSDLYLIKFLDTSTKHDFAKQQKNTFFPCGN